ncbi:hypothetical protein [Streptomyces sp. NPDC002324]
MTLAGVYAGAWPPVVRRSHHAAGALSTASGAAEGSPSTTAVDAGTAAGSKVTSTSQV